MTMATSTATEKDAIVRAGGDVQNGFPEGITSLLDTDLYKLTMQCAVLKYFPDVGMSSSARPNLLDFRPSSRNSADLYCPRCHLQLHEPHQAHEADETGFSLARGPSRQCVTILSVQRKRDCLGRFFAGLGSISVTPQEIQYLERVCPFLTQPYLTFLRAFRLQPAKHVRVIFQTTDTPDDDDDDDDSRGDTDFDIRGRWVDTILYEIVLLALTSEAYFRFCDRDWTYEGQEGLSRLQSSQSSL